MPINVFEWQVLRKVLRDADDGGTLGRDLRLVPSRRTKDGRFLGWFVAAGLLRVHFGRMSDPFAARFKLTDLGRTAAEYGEFEVSANMLGELAKLRNETLSRAKA